MGCAHSTTNAAVVVDTKHHRGGDANGTVSKPAVETNIHSDHTTLTKNPAQEAPNSTKSMRTATTAATTDSSLTYTTVTTASREIVPVLSYELNDDCDDDDDDEVTTECDDASVQSKIFLLHSGRAAKAAFATKFFFSDGNNNNQRQQQPSNHHSPNQYSYRYMDLDELSTDDGDDCNTSYYSSNNKEMIYFDDETNSANVDDDDAVSTTNDDGDNHHVISATDIPCTILTIRKHDRNHAKKSAEDGNVLIPLSVDQMQLQLEEQHNDSTRLLLMHQEQQKKLLSLMTTLLPWTHAILLRKQRHIQLRQVLISSLLWFNTMLFWLPSTMRRRAMNHTNQNNTNTHPNHPFATATTTGTIRNPTTLFRR